MRKGHEKEHSEKLETEGDQVMSNNELLALIRERIAKSRSGSEGKRPKKLEIPEAE